MISCLEDAIDVILQDPIPSADQPPAAFMALLDTGFQLLEAEMVITRTSVVAWKLLVLGLLRQAVGALAPAT